jgi:hypothetical protein
MRFCTVRTVPGNHRSILTARNISRLAELLSACQHTCT